MTARKFDIYKPTFHEVYGHDGYGLNLTYLGFTSNDEPRIIDLRDKTLIKLKKFYGI